MSQTQIAFAFPMIVSLITQIAAAPSHTLPDLRAPKTYPSSFQIEFQLPGKCRRKLKLSSRDVIIAHNFARRKSRDKKNEPCSKRNGAEIDRNPQNVHNFSISNTGEAGGGPKWQQLLPANPELPGWRLNFYPAPVDGLLLSRACWHHLGIAGSLTTQGEADRSTGKQ